MNVFIFFFIIIIVLGCKFPFNCSILDLLLIFFIIIFLSFS